jgi:hypothetical protein
MRLGIDWMGRVAPADVPFVVMGVPFRRIIGGIGFVLLYSFKGYAGFPEPSGFPSGRKCFKDRLEIGLGINHYRRVLRCALP